MQFFKRYNYITLINLIFVLSIAFGLFCLQYSTQYQYDVNKLKSEFDDRVLHLNILQVAKDQVESMKIKAETYWRTHPNPVSPSALFSQLRPIAEPYYSLDVINPPFYPEVTGNLTGKGSLENRDADFYRDIEMALELNTLFPIIAHNVPNAVWIYYMSANHFTSIYPWVASQDFKFDEEFYQHEFYRLGLPENNAEHRTFWTEAYMDEAGKGLMVTCAAPVYEGEHFRGTVALDITLDILNKFVQNFGNHYQNIFVINQNNQLLAHPNLVKSDAKEVPLPDHAFPETLRNQVWQKLFQFPEAQLVEIDGYMMIYANLHYLPWKLVFWMPKRQMIQQVLYIISWGFLILLPSLLILLLLTYRITREEFILPAQYLVEHIKAENLGYDKPIPKIPANWKIWFTTISRIFAENRELFAELKSHSRSLEEQTQVISEHNQLLSLKNNELERLNREKNEFLGIVVHDLKNPLSGILGLAELILESEGDIPTEKLLDYATMMQSATNNMFQLVTNLLDVNAIESGKIHIKLEVADIFSIVQSVIRNYVEQARGKNIRILNNVAATPYRASTDIQIARQILDNLISNAIKYSPHGRNVYIRLTDTEEWIRCEIQDEGQGLSAEEQQKLFTKFTRLSARPTGGEHSTGLGLFIVKKLVDAMHARVECHSEVGKGANFIVKFPKKW